MSFNNEKSPQPTNSLLKRSCIVLFKISFRTHLLISILLRLLLICYGQLHDVRSEVPYTDIDYKVVTDGARHVLKGQTPFARHTYRYSPLLAYMQIPNIWIHPCMGKVLYTAFDILVALLIYVLVRNELQSQCRKAVESLLCKIGKQRAVSNSAAAYQQTDENKRPQRLACASACFWLYNPLTAVISTRGNGDSFSSFFVILTIYFLAKAEDVPSRSNWFILVAGLTHGFAIHLRLYPILFSLAYFLSISPTGVRNTRDFLRQLLFPSARQLLLVFGTLVSLLSLTGYFYYLYGWQYLYEAYLYHFVRKDVRHNFSLYFLLQYVSSGSSGDTPLPQKVLILAPEFLLLFYLSLSFGRFRQTLPFCIFTLAFVLVTFNSVVTSQYFVWYLSLLPICLNNLQSISGPKALVYFGLWLLAQGLWLLPAYLLEFRTWHTFYWIGAQGATFFGVNNFLLTRLIKHYSFTSFKVNFKKLF